MRPVGVSPALEKVASPPEDWWRGNLWPPGKLDPADPAPPWPDAAQKPFRRRAWSPVHYATFVLGEFVNATVAGQKWDGFQADLGTVPTGSALDDEMQELLDLVEYRPGVIGEAQAQAGLFIDYFCGVMSFNACSCPATFDMLTVALTVGHFQAMHYKALFNRARPSHHSANLLPPIDPPGHPSFPSGHATQAYLVAHSLGAVMPAEASGALGRMADRIARNREVVGVHYRSDSEAGRTLALKSFPLLMACPSFAALIPLAQAEW